MKTVDAVQAVNIKMDYTVTRKLTAADRITE